MFEDEIDLENRPDVKAALSSMLHMNFIYMRSSELNASSGDAVIIIHAIGEAFHNVPLFLSSNVNKRFSPSYFITCLEILIDSTPRCTEGGKKLLLRIHRMAVSLMMECGLRV
ncbi:hypothetical protein [Magnetospirillum sp. ME-1]|uniref:hypothetical protein n=1 Tax=Magnetospirillum sp. ME-1 TaxID=1639348 RepID=UPI0011AEAD84|nr:hypothetical protein [Magnetospirillum sp. ME-1]